MLRGGIGTAHVRSARTSRRCLVGACGVRGIPYPLATRGWGCIVGQGVVGLFYFIVGGPNRLCQCQGPGPPAGGAPSRIATKCPYTSGLAPFSVGCRHPRGPRPPTGGVPSRAALSHGPLTTDPASPFGIMAGVAFFNPFLILQAAYLC